MGRKPSFLRYSPALLVAILAAMLLVQVPMAGTASSNLGSVVHTDAITNRYLRLNGAGCVTTAIATNTNCWSLTSGGAVGASVPGSSEMMIFDSASGSGTGKINAAMSVYGFQETSGTVVFDMDSQPFTVGAGGFTQSVATTNVQSSTFTLDGNFNNVGSNIFDGGNSALGTVVVASDITISTQDDSLHFFDRMIVNPGVTATLLTDIRFDEWTGHLTVNGIFEAGIHKVRFQQLTVNTGGKFRMNGFEVGAMDMSSSGGNTHTILLSPWTAYQPQLNPGVPGTPLISWTFDPNTPAAVVAITFHGMFPSTSYNLKRDGIVVGTQTSDSSGVVTYSVTGGWSPHSMDVSRAAGASRYLVLNDVGCSPSSLATDVDCWAATSGGTGGVGVPGIADTARLDGASGSGTGTLDAAMTVAIWDSTGFAGTITTNGFALTAATGAVKISGIFNAGSSVITAHGDFNVDSSAGTFNQQTSTVVMAANGDIYPTFTFYTTASPNFYKLTINAGVTATIKQDDVRLDGNGGQLTVNGMLTSTGTVGVTIRAYSTQANPLVVGPSGDISTLVGTNPPGLIFRACEDGTYTINLPSTTYPEVRLANGKGGWTMPGCVGGANVHATFSMLGPISTMGSGAHLLAIASSYGSIGTGSLTVKTNGYSLTTGVLSVSAGGYLDLGPDSPAVPTDFRFATNAGTLVPVRWTRYAPQVLDILPSMAWRFTIGSPGAAVTMTLRGMTPSTSYDLKRDGIVVATASSDPSGILTYVITGGWSTNDMTISRSVGGGAPQPPTPPTPPTPAPPFQSLLGSLGFHDGLIIGMGLLIIVILAILGALLGLGAKQLLVLAVTEVFGLLGVSWSFAFGTGEILALAFVYAMINMVVGKLIRVSLRASLALAAAAVVLVIVLADILLFPII